MSRIEVMQAIRNPHDARKLAFAIFVAMFAAASAHHAHGALPPGASSTTMAEQTARPINPTTNELRDDGAGTVPAAPTRAQRFREKVDAAVTDHPRSDLVVYCLVSL